MWNIKHLEGLPVAVKDDFKRIELNDHALPLFMVIDMGRGVCVDKKAS